MLCSIKRLQQSGWTTFAARSILHAGSLNPTGARRRSTLIGYFAEPRYASHLETAHLRNVRMQTSERFDP